MTEKIEISQKLNALTNNTSSNDTESNFKVESESHCVEAIESTTTNDVCVESSSQNKNVENDNQEVEIIDDHSGNFKAERVVSPSTEIIASSVVRVASPPTSKVIMSQSESNSISASLSEVHVSIPSAHLRVASPSISTTISKLESLSSPAPVRISSNSLATSDGSKSSRITALVKTLENSPAMQKLKSPSTSKVASPVSFNTSLQSVQENQISPRVLIPCPSSNSRSTSSNRRSVTTRNKLGDDDSSNFVADILYEDDLEEMSRNYLSYAFTNIDKKNAAPSTLRFNTHNQTPNIKPLSRMPSSIYTDSENRDRRNSSIIFNQIASRDFVRDTDIAETDEEEDFVVDNAPIMSASEAAALDRSNELQQEGLKLPLLLEWLEKKSPTLV